MLSRSPATDHGCNTPRETDASEREGECAGCGHLGAHDKGDGKYPNKLYILVPDKGSKEQSGTRVGESQTGWQASDQREVERQVATYQRRGGRKNKGGQQSSKSKGGGKDKVAIQGARQDRRGPREQGKHSGCGYQWKWTGKCAC